MTVMHKSNVEFYFFKDDKSTLHGVLLAPKYYGSFYDFDPQLARRLNNWGHITHDFDLKNFRMKMKSTNKKGPKFKNKTKNGPGRIDLMFGDERTGGYLFREGKDDVSYFLSDGREVHVPYIGQAWYESNEDAIYVDKIPDLRWIRIS